MYEIAFFQISLMLCTGHRFACKWPCYNILLVIIFFLFSFSWLHRKAFIFLRQSADTMCGQQKLCSFCTFHKSDKWLSCLARQKNAIRHNHNAERRSRLWIHCMGTFASLNTSCSHMRNVKGTALHDMAYQSLTGDINEHHIMSLSDEIQYIPSSS